MYWSEKHFISVTYIGNLNINLAYTKDFLEVEIQKRNFLGSSS